jgi:hypothetical protein
LDVFGGKIREFSMDPKKGSEETLPRKFTKNSLKLSI